MLEIEFRRDSSSRSYIYCYLPEKSPIKDGVFVILLRDVESLLRFGDYCAKLVLNYGDVVREVLCLNLDDLVVFLKKYLVHIGKVYQLRHGTKVLKVKLHYEISENTLKALIFENELELDLYLRELARKVGCYVLYQVVKKARSLQQLFQSLARMSQALEKSGIRIRSNK